MRYLTAAILSALVLFALFFSMQYLMPALWLLLMLGTSYEVCKALGMAGQPACKPLAIGALPAVCLVYLIAGPTAALAVGCLLFLAAISLRVWLPQKPLSYTVSTLSVWVYPGLPAAALLVMTTYPPVSQARNLIMLTVASSAMADSIAMFGGMLFGRHKLCPAISPKKTVEGLIAQLLGGCLGAVAVGAICTYALGQPLSGAANCDMLHMPFLGLLIAATTAVGDLVASTYKRAAGLKDFSKLLPGHGGLLDRVDGILPSACVVLVYALLAGWL